MDCRFGLTSFNFDFGAFANTLGLRADWSPVASKGFPTMPLPKIDVASLPHLAEQTGVYGSHGQNGAPQTVSAVPLWLVLVAGDLLQA